MLLLASIADYLHRQFLNNSLQAWLTGAVTTAAVLLAALVLRRVLISRLSLIAARTINKIDDLVVDLLKQTRTWVLVAFAILSGLSALTLHSRVAVLVAPAMKLVLLWQIALWAIAAVAFWVKLQMERTSTHERTSIAMLTAIGFAAKVFVWVLIFITALKSVFSVEITPLITGLGVSGIAVALAVQNILGDLLAALAIVFDKPFDVGDNIGVDSITGTVERIGLKTTHIRAQSGEQVIIGNGDLLKSRLRNFRRMTQRRVAFSLDVPLDTPPDVLARVPQILEGIVTARKPVRFERSHVASFTESAVRVETVYYVLDPDYKLYMDIQQAINLEILRRFKAEQLKIALPSQTVYHQGLDVRTTAASS